MKAAKKTSLLTFAVALLTSVGTNHLPDCHTMGYECMMQHLVNGGVMNENSILLAINNTHEYCTIHQGYQMCMQPAIDRSMCDQWSLHVIEFYVYKANFTCSDEGSLLAEAARGSVCVSNPEEYEMYDWFMRCYSFVHFDMCQETIRQRECLLGHVRSRCGEAFAQFVDGLRSRYLYNYYCIESHDSEKRSLELFRRHV